MLSESETTIVAEHMSEEWRGDATFQCRDDGDLWIGYELNHQNGENSYHINYRYETPSELLRIWFDDRVFRTYETAAATHDALVSMRMGASPSAEPHERLVTDVDLETIPLEDVLANIDEVLGAAENWVGTDASAGEATGHIRQEVEQLDLPRSEHNEISQQLEQVNQTTYVYQQQVEDGREAVREARTGECSEQELVAVKDACEQVFSRFLDSWMASSALYGQLSLVAEAGGDEQWAQTEQDGYRDVFETALEYSGHYAVLAKRLCPKLEAHLRQ